MEHPRCPWQDKRSACSSGIPWRVASRPASPWNWAKSKHARSMRRSWWIWSRDSAAQRRERFLCFTPDDRKSRRYFEELAGNEFQLWPQPDGDLGTRMQRFFDEHLRVADDRVVVIGSDSPTLPREHLERAFDDLSRVDCAVGPATDGGYYLIGMTGRVWPVFSDMAWSNAGVLDQTVSRLVGLGARLALLPVWYDVDTPDDWRMTAGHIRALDACGSPINLEATRQCLGTSRFPA